MDTGLRSRWDRFAPILLIGLVALLFTGAPHGGAFYWSDAPRHALNGVFVADFLRAMPLGAASDFAYTYYAKYPALTILFYPPLFYFLSAPFFLLFGVSHEVALIPVFVLYAAFAVGSYRLFRFWTAPSVAFCAAVALAMAPENAFWGRQVMLEIPAFAALVWSTVCFMHYRRGGKAAQLYLAAALLVCAMYIKISVGFMAPVLAAALLATDPRVLRRKPVWIAAALSALALVPLVAITVKFGQANVQSVSGIADSSVSRQSIQGWLWYARQMPNQLGWPLALTAGVACISAIAWRRRIALARGDAVFWWAWLLVGYVFFSAIDLKEARHSVYLLPPLVFAAYMLLSRARYGVMLCGLLTLAVMAQTVFWRPVHYVDGYARAAAFVAEAAPKDSAVIFSGYRDGAFVFNMRAREDRPDLSVVRADKLLLRVAVRRELGVEEKAVAEGEIAALIDRVGAAYLVVQPGFWIDLPAMQRFERVLASRQFEKVATIPTPANYPSQEKELVIYRNMGNVAPKANRIDIDLPMINRTFKAPPAKN
jgi:Dolichyl-phosphate-mannose-protein mannosyltransferase